MIWLSRCSLTISIKIHEIKPAIFLSGKSSLKGRKVIAMLKALVEPISYDFTVSEEDKALAATIDGAEAIFIIK